MSLEHLDHQDLCAAHVQIRGNVRGQSEAILPEADKQLKKMFGMLLVLRPIYLWPTPTQLPSKTAGIGRRRSCTFKQMACLPLA